MHSVKHQKNTFLYKNDLYFLHGPLHYRFLVICMSNMLRQNARFFSFLFHFLSVETDFSTFFFLEFLFCSWSFIHCVWAKIKKNYPILFIEVSPFGGQFPFQPVVCLRNFNEPTSLLGEKKIAPSSYYFPSKATTQYKISTLEISWRRKSIEFIDGGE